jgi:hypothetical protein
MSKPTSPPPRVKLIDRGFTLGAHSFLLCGGEDLKPGDIVRHTVEGVVASVEKWKGDSCPTVSINITRKSWNRI